MMRYSSLVIVLLAGACGHDCVPMPCPLPIAVHLSLTATTTHAPVKGATIRVNGGTTLQCDGDCIVTGGAGKYVLDIEAPGFQSAQRTVTVTGASATCACEIVNQQSVDVALVPAS